MLPVNIQTAAIVTDKLLAIFYNIKFKYDQFEWIFFLLLSHKLSSYHPLHTIITACRMCAP